ncbi:hypothetical protein LI811_002082 [Salmonella enterica]|nr:hypothetical protein [Salmonella enterica]
MSIQEKTTVVVFNACHADKAAADSANALYSLEVEYPMTLNDLSLLCESVPAVDRIQFRERCL